MKEDIIFIIYIKESIEKIEEYTKNVSKNEFLKDTKLQDAIIRRIEIIGESTKNIPVSFRKKYEHIPWTKIAGMRDKLTHHYFGININTIWKVVKEDIPRLKKDILKILETRE